MTYNDVRLPRLSNNPGGISEGKNGESCLREITFLSIGSELTFRALGEDSYGKSNLQCHKAAKIVEQLRRYLKRRKWRERSEIQQFREHKISALTQINAARVTYRNSRLPRLLNSPGGISDNRNEESILK